MLCSRKRTLVIKQGTTSLLRHTLPEEKMTDILRFVSFVGGFFYLKKNKKIELRYNIVQILTCGSNCEVACKISIIGLLFSSV